MYRFELFDIVIWQLAQYLCTLSIYLNEFKTRKNYRNLYNFIIKKLFQNTTQ